MQAIKELRDNTIELSAREAPVNHEILHREVSTNTESDTDLHILGREHAEPEDYVQGVRVPPLIARVRN